MKIISVVFILLVTIGCNQSPQPKLTMADLKFADYEREWIAKNKVDSVYEILHASPENDVYPFKYDTLGRLIAEGQGSFFQTGKSYQYDSLGLITQEKWVSDIRSINCYTHYFDGEKRILIRYINWCAGKDENQAISKHYFDIVGREIKKVEMRNREVWETRYEYDSGNRLFKIVKRVVVRDRSRGYIIRPYIPVETTTTVFYTTNKPDSAITINKFLHAKLKKDTVKVFYDSLGLRLKTVYRQGTESSYKYILRKP